MTRLEEDVHIAQLLELYKTHGRQGGAQDLMAVLGYVALMEKQLVAVSDELRGVRQELAALRQPGPVAEERQKLADRLDDAVQTARKQLDVVRQSILQWAKDTLAAVKQAGATALDCAVRTLHIRDGLEAASTRLKNAAADVDRTAGRIAAINARHRDAGMHLRNFGRAIRGREPLAQAKPEGKLSRGAQSVFSGVRNVLAGIARDADAAIDRLAKLEQAVRPSMLDSLRSRKEPTAKAAPTPAPGKAQDMSL